jgi:PelA/Pel-15E family pectate lyase
MFTITGLDVMTAFYPRPIKFAFSWALGVASRAGILFSVSVGLAQEPAPVAMQVRWGNALLRQSAGWYASMEARRAADNVLLYQSQHGAWPKNTDLLASNSPTAIAAIQKSGEADSIDNGATTLPINFLARMAHATGEAKYKDAVLRGIDYLLVAQYPNGGWPQFYPLRKGYYSHITFNDGAMIRALTVLRDVAAGETPFDFVDASRRTKAAAAVARGTDCILRTQIKQGGKLTAWCAQHDEKTLAPAWARNYEIPSLSGSESVGVVRFLMEIEKPMPEIIAAVESSVAWLNAVAITGLRYERGVQADGKKDGWVKPDATSGRLWARFYELGSNRPIFTGRDKTVHYSLSEIDRERRGGYDFYGDWAETLLSRDYPRWVAKHKIEAAQSVAPTAASAGK